MAKRARGSTSRPGQRAPLDRTSLPRRASGERAESGAPAPSRSLTAEEEARAAELEAQIVAAERATERQATDRSRRAAADVEPRTRSGSITVRTVEEYAYVARDVRRIVLIGGLLFAILIGSWIVAQASGATLF